MAEDRPFPMATRANTSSVIGTRHSLTSDHGQRPAEDAAGRHLHALQTPKHGGVS